MALAAPAIGNPGNREWSRSAVLDETGHLTLYYTAAGPGGVEGGWQQRLYQTYATMDLQNETPQLLNWSAPTVSVQSDGHHYVVVDQTDGNLGTIKAFRDPAYFCNPADGVSYLLFAAPLAASYHNHNGQVLDDLRVTVFIDSASTGGRVVQDKGEARLNFGGTLAPLLKIALEDASVTLVPLNLDSL